MAPVLLKPLSDQVLASLFEQSIIGSKRGDPYIDALRRLSRLIEAELQGQVFAIAAKRAADRARPRKKVAGRWVLIDAGAVAEIAETR